MYWRGRSFDVVKYQERRPDELVNWNFRAEIFAFSRRLQENLSEDTLRKIFTHKSYVDHIRKEQAQTSLPDLNIESNAEFIHRGDVLLSECLKPYLRHVFNMMPEDGIEAITNYLKSEAVLSDISNWIGCKKIILSKEWPPSSTTMAETISALLAGIEADFDLSRVRRFVVDIIATYLNNKDILDDVWIIPNPKETLNLLLSNSQLPSYEPRIIFQTGVRTVESCHIVGLYVNQRLVGSGPGETLAIAEECAAFDTLERFFDLKVSRKPLIYGEASEAIDYNAHTKEHESMRTWKIALEQ